MRRYATESTVVYCGLFYLDQKYIKGEKYITMKPCSGTWLLLIFPLNFHISPSEYVFLISLNYISHNCIYQDCHVYLSYTCTPWVYCEMRTIIQTIQMPITKGCPWLNTPLTSWIWCYIVDSILITLQSKEIQLGIILVWKFKRENGCQWTQLSHLILVISNFLTRLFSYATHFTYVLNCFY